jgi:hypothetical protein
MQKLKPGICGRSLSYSSPQTIKILTPCTIRKVSPQTLSLKINKFIINFHFLHLPQFFFPPFLPRSTGISFSSLCMMHYTVFVILIVPLTSRMNVTFTSVRRHRSPSVPSLSATIRASLSHLSVRTTAVTLPNVSCFPTPDLIRPDAANNFWNSATKYYALL